MNISTDFADYTPSTDKISEGYEWWYFDGLNDTGDNGFVIILYKSNPFSTNKIKDSNNDDLKEAYPAISISVYRDGKTVYYSFLEYEEQEFTWNPEINHVTIGGNSLQLTVRGKQVYYELSLNQELESGHSISGIIRGRSTLSNKKLIRENKNSVHTWNLVIPASKLEVELDLEGKHGFEQLNYAGTGYCDHNVGSEPLKDSFEDWYWGRYHFRESTLIYYLMNSDRRQQYEAWLIDKSNQKVIDTFNEIKPAQHSRNLFGLKSARKVEFNSDTSKISLQVDNPIDNGPFYQRFLGSAIMDRDGELQVSKGISEYIYPKNIYAKHYWPLVHMRLRYMNSDPHWVQKLKKLYPLTW